MNISIISSSTRISRISHRIALALEKAIAKNGHNVTVIDLKELNLPPFEERISHLESPSEAMKDTLEVLKASDGQIFLTPEYNGAPTSGLKNFIDVFAKAGFSGKPIGVATGSTGAMGGIRAAYMVQQMILTANAYPQPRMLLVGKMDQVISEAGDLLDERTEKQFEGFVSAYLPWVEKLSAE